MGRYSTPATVDALKAYGEIDIVTVARHPADRIGGRRPRRLHRLPREIEPQ